MAHELAVAGRGQRLSPGDRLVWVARGIGAPAYARAVKIKRDMHEAWYNWGVTLYVWARAQLPEDRERAVRLWEEAGTKYARAVEIKPAKHEAWYNWGTALYQWAEALLSTDRERAVRLWEEAGAKYARAVEIKPHMHEAWNSWGASLLSLWHPTHDEAVLGAAEEKLKRAEELDAEGAYYNLACLAALRRRTEEAFERLGRELEAGRIGWEHVAGDPDWEALREDERYKELEAKYAS
jgi:tetratricopeptide (TPR) repeat protein